MELLILDLARSLHTCTDHTVVRPHRKIRRLTDKGTRKLKTVFKPDDIPGDALKHFLLEFRYRAIRVGSMVGNNF